MFSPAAAACKLCVCSAEPLPLLILCRQVTHCGDTGIYADCAASEWTDITTSHCKCDGMTVDFPASAIAGAAKDLREALLKSLKEKPHIIQARGFALVTQNACATTDRAAPSVFHSPRGAPSCVQQKEVDAARAGLLTPGINATRPPLRTHSLQNLISTNNGWSGLDCMGGACVDVEGAELSQNGINAIEITERHERLQGATARNRLRGITAKKNGVAAVRVLWRVFICAYYGAPDQGRKQLFHHFCCLAARNDSEFLGSVTCRWCTSHSWIDFALHAPPLHAVTARNVLLTTDCALAALLSLFLRPVWPLLARLLRRRVTTSCNAAAALPSGPAAWRR